MIMALAVVFFTCIDVSAKWLNIAGFPVLQIVFARYAGHLIYASILFAPREGVAMFHSHAPGRQFIRSCFLFIGTFLNFQALKYLPITITTTIAFAGPIVVTLLAIPILGEKVGARRLIAVCVGFLGVLVVVQPWGAEFHPAMLLSLSTLLFASMYFIMTRMLAGVDSNATMQVWSSAVATIALAPFALRIWVWPETTAQWVFLLVIGAFGALGHICATLAHRFADASILAPIIYAQIFLASIAGIVMFATYPTIWTLVGGLIIIASGLYIWNRERAKRPNRTQITDVMPK